MMHKRSVNKNDQSSLALLANNKIRFASANQQTLPSYVKICQHKKFIDLCTLCIINILVELNNKTKNRNKKSAVIYTECVLTCH